MEDNFRNVLIIISTIVILAIFIHGYWVIRKQKNPYKLDTKKEQNDVKLKQTGFDKDGFDKDGVSKPKIVGRNTKDNRDKHTEFDVSDNIVSDNYHSTSPHQVDETATDSESFSDFLDKDIPEVNVPKIAQDFPSDDISNSHDALNELKPQAMKEGKNKVNYDGDTIENTIVAQTAVKETEQSVYQQPVIQPKESLQAVNSSLNTINTKNKFIKRKQQNKQLDEIKRNQMEIDFDIDLDDMPKMSASHSETTKAKKNHSTKIEEQVIVLSVVMPQGQTISGASLLQTLLTLGLRYGDMNIFHRHEDNAGNGKITFSLANLMNPGTFDLDSIENFTTQGVSLFMVLPNAGDAFEVFDNMLNAAKQLVIEYKAQLLDDKRSVMTKQTEQHYISRIREFERKRRIGSF